MSKFEDTCRTIKEEIKEVDDRNFYFASLVSERLRQTTQKYEDQLDHFLKVLESSEVNRRDFDHASSSMNKVLKLIEESYESISKLILILGRNSIN